MNFRKCERCEAVYSTGKDYGDFWQQFDFGKYKDAEKKGLCEFCNIKTYVGALNHNLVCTSLICDGCNRPSIMSGDICNLTTKEQKEKMYRDRGSTVLTTPVMRLLNKDVKK